ncbi:unnamed protein product, partial [Durusdinium trenchii]
QNLSAVHVTHALTPPAPCGPQRHFTWSCTAPLKEDSLARDRCAPLQSSGPLPPAGDESSSWKCPMLVGGGELSAEDWMRKVFSVTDSKAPSGLLSDMNKTKRGGGSDQEERPPTFHPL